MKRKQQVRKHAAQGNQRRSTSALQDDFEPRDIPRYAKPATEPLKAKTAAQERYLKAIKSSTLVFGVGPAGTGKSYVATAWAAQQLRDGLVEKVIVTRPAEEAGESLGFLPGELEEKFAPYLAPLRSIFIERLGEGPYQYAIDHGKIDPQPLAYMRGTTFKNCVVILDEAQNVSPKQMKMFLTRIGENCTVIVNGDLAQQDKAGPSGLADALARISFIPAVRVITFESCDIVRSGLVQEIVEAYEQPLVS